MTRLIRSTTDLWTSRHPEAIRITSGRMYVRLDHNLCVLDIPRVVGRGVETACRFQRYVVPIFEHAPRQWWMFATYDRHLEPQQVDDLRASGAMLLGTETLELPVPGTDRRWISEPTSEYSIPNLSHLTSLTLEMARGRRRCSQP